MGIWPILRGEILVKKAGFAGWTAPFGLPQNLDDKHSGIEGNRQYVAGFYWMRGLSRCDAIDANMTALHQFGRL
jgi:hypothetical protein